MSTNPNPFSNPFLQQKRDYTSPGDKIKGFKDELPLGFPKETNNNFVDQSFYDDYDPFLGLPRLKRKSPNIEGATYTPPVEPKTSTNPSQNQTTPPLNLGTNILPQVLGTAYQWHLNNKLNKNVVNVPLPKMSFAPTAAQKQGVREEGLSGAARNAYAQGMANNQRFRRTADPTRNALTELGMYSSRNQALGNLAAANEEALQGQRNTNIGIANENAQASMTNEAARTDFLNKVRQMEYQNNLTNAQQKAAQTNLIHQNRNALITNLLAGASQMNAESNQYKFLNAQKQQELDAKRYDNLSYYKQAGRTLSEDDETFLTGYNKNSNRDMTFTPTTGLRDLFKTMTGGRTLF